MSKSPPRHSFFWVSLALFWLGLSLGLTLQQVWSPSAEQQLYLILAGGLILVGRAFLGAVRAEERLHEGDDAPMPIAAQEHVPASAPLERMNAQALQHLFLQQSALEHAAAAVERAQASKEARGSPKSDCPTSLSLQQIRVRQGIRYEVVPPAAPVAAAPPDTTGPLLSPGRKAPGGYHLK